MPVRRQAYGPSRRALPVTFGMYSFPIPLDVGEVELA